MILSRSFNKCLFVALGTMTVSARQAFALGIEIDAAASIGKISIDNNGAAVTDQEKTLQNPWYFGGRVDPRLFIGLNPAISAAIGLGLEFCGFYASTSVNKTTVTISSSAFLLEPNAKISFLIDRNYLLTAGLGYSLLANGSVSTSISGDSAENGISIKGDLKTFSSLRIRAGFGYILSKKNNTNVYLAYQFMAAGTLRDSKTAQEIKDTTFNGHALNIGFVYPIPLGSTAAAEIEDDSMKNSKDPRKKNSRMQKNQRKSGTGR